MALQSIHLHLQSLSVQKMLLRLAMTAVSPEQLFHLESPVQKTRNWSISTVMHKLQASGLVAECRLEGIESGGCFTCIDL
jgi:hypothetical protein